MVFPNHFFHWLGPGQENIASNVGRFGSWGGTEKKTAKIEKSSLPP